jgi:hypothetical protein
MEERIRALRGSANDPALARLAVTLTVCPVRSVSEHFDFGLSAKNGRSTIWLSFYATKLVLVVDDALANIQVAREILLSILPQEPPRVSWFTLPL